MSIKVLIVDDHEVVRQGLRALLSDGSEFEVVAEAENGEDALRQAERLSPDLAIVDLRLNGMTGLSLLAALSNQYPTMRVLVLSMHSDEAYVAEAFRVGAHGYIVKGAPSTEIVSGLRVINGGQRYISEGLPSYLIGSTSDSSLAQIPFARLTEREVGVLRLLAEGFRSKEIGQQLEIAARTVESHRSHIARKLELKSATDLLAYALRHDLLTQPR